MATHIKHLLTAFIKTTEKRQTENKQINATIERVLGADTKKYIRVHKVSGRKIFFSSTNSAASYNLKIKKQQLVTELNKYFPGIKEVVVKINQQ